MHWSRERAILMNVVARITPCIPKSRSSDPFVDENFCFFEGSRDLQSGSISYSRGISNTEAYSSSDYACYQVKNVVSCINVHKAQEQSIVMTE